ncbi:hypothetical protein [Micrococcus terreus]|uniref:Uncharacterized protein n=1 Tax=Micrococcus terreus TaxID=574650 RepID=A0A1I7MED8_9MICC|nr:hypothetical protein [Micrococcus terreus]SFV20302.1 hypothetical protein SAMN04487966_101295 [Micrococcus terreus]
MSHDDDDREDNPDHEPGHADSSPDEGDAQRSLDDGPRPTTGFRLQNGFARSLMPNMDDFVAKMLAPLQDQMKGMLPDFSGQARGIMDPLNRRLQDQMKAVMPDVDALTKSVIEPYNEQLRTQVASFVASMPTFSASAIDFPSLKDIGFSPQTDAMLKRVSAQHASMVEGFRVSLKPLFDPELLRGFNRALLPPNLREYADEIQAHQVHEFLEQEGIPLYLVPGGRTALRLLRAEDRSARRQVLGACYDSIIEDCAAVLERTDHKAVGDEVKFALDGLGAMRAGHARSAQAMFTVTLDTLIYRFHPDQTVRRAITNRKKGADVPDAVDEMGVHEAMVWLPIWNAHEQFWKHKGDKVPHYYSRHASVHGVSSRQFSKRNCVQVLMLVTSLIGYANRIARAASHGSD